MGTGLIRLLTRWKSALIGAGAAVAIGGAVAGGIALAQRPAAPASSEGVSARIASTPAPPPAGHASASPPSSAGKEAGGVGQAHRQDVDDFLNQLAQNLHISRSDLNAALQSSADQEIDKAVAANRLTPAQAARLKQRIAAGKFPLGLHLGAGRTGGAVSGSSSTVPTQ